MTYCLAIKVNDGLVFASDSRTNAGMDYVSTYSKMHNFDVESERLYVLLTSGNLAVTQAVVNAIRRDLERSDAGISLNSVEYMFDAARYIGEVSFRIQQQHSEQLQQHGINAEASFILGGQIGGRPPDIFLIYPQGNYITASEETPFLQIGETKYGRPILDRVIHPETTLEDAARCALVSLDSTMRSNISVGPPVELAICKRNSMQIDRHLSLKSGTPFYSRLQESWNEGLHRAFERLPRFDWERKAEHD
ncbi:MAG: peptidase [Acidiferrobacterales bacterium]